MPKKSKQTVFIDTSFLITIFDSSRKNHENAKRYYQYFINNSIDMYLSTIVISEYQQKGDIQDIVLYRVILMLGTELSLEILRVF